METEFTPLAALLGGGLIGLASIGLMALNGRIAGISGLLGKVLPPFGNSGPFADKTALGFVLGLLLAVPIFALFKAAPNVWVVPSVGQLIIAGVITGIGVTLGSGCTSGHGVCGISRLSKRSIFATLMFMLTAFITVYVTRHMMGA